MNKRMRIAVIAGVVLVLGAAGWYWWNHRRIELFGGVQPFMRHMKKLHDSVATEIGREGKLTPEYGDMERLTQAAQDVFPVFGKDSGHRGNDPKFGPLATELMRYARAMEYAWEADDKTKVKAEFARFTTACNNCHNQLGNGKPPRISAP